MIARVKRLARHVVDRSLTPHLADQSDEIERRVARQLAAAAPAGASDPLLADFNVRLHELRTIELRRLPIDGGVLLSAGCSGRWYFDWLDECAGPFERHIGVELYSPEPDGLPDDVTWIAESASSMPGVADSSVDVVFSGQNIEHLWVDDLVGFLLEANRVVRSDGWLVVDSPNRVAVEQMGWTHPEHTIELSAAEASALFELAGFTPRVARGLWNSRRPRTGEWLPLTVDVGDVSELIERSAGGRDVDDAFVWWIEAQKTGEAASRSAVESAVVELFRSHWQHRVNRAAQADPANGVAMRTHAFPLFPGAYTVRSSDPSLTVRLTTLDGRELGSGVGECSGSIDAAELGVHAELIDGSVDGVAGDDRTDAPTPRVEVLVAPLDR